MADDQPPLRARPWKRPPDAGRSSAPYSSYRFIFRLLGIPVLAVCGLFLYNGVHDRFFLPACDSSTAKRSLADVLKQLKLEPTSYAPVKTVSTTKNDVVCSAVMPLPDGGNVAIDFTFHWQGNTANMKYSVARKPADSAPVTPPLR